MTEVVLLGGGGHATSVLAALRASGTKVRGYAAPEPSALACPYLGGDEILDRLDPSSIEVVNAVGVVASTALRRRLHRTIEEAGLRVASVIHPRAFVDPTAVLAQGVQVLAGAVVNAGARIGAGALVNTGTIIEHDVVVGAGAHIAPGAVVAGGVRIADGAVVGLGARIIQGLTVGSESMIGAGAVVLDDVADGDIVVGVPARRLERSRGERR